MRKTFDRCGDCHYDYEPTEYFPDVKRWGTCQICYQDGFVERVNKTLVKRGSEALLSLPEGEAATVTVLSLDLWDVVVLMGDKVVHAVPESIGLGCDITLLGVTDQGAYIVA